MSEEDPFSEGSDKEEEEKKATDAPQTNQQDNPFDIGNMDFDKKETAVFEENTSLN